MLVFNPIHFFNLIKMTKLFLFCFLFPLLAFGQKKTKTIKQIYSSTIFEIFRGQPCIIAVNETTRNYEISEVHFDDIIVGTTSRRDGTPTYPALDASWLSILKDADIKKQTLRPKEIPDLKVPGFAVLMVPSDSSVQIGGGSYTYTEGTPAPPPPKYWIDSRIDLSTIMLFRKKAIIEIGKYSGSLDGEGLIYFLEKIKNRKRKKGEPKKKWIVVSSLRRWVA
jgi:hypothetical protein